MSILSIIADLLESGARALRAADAAPQGGPASADDRAPEATFETRRSVAWTDEPAKPARARPTGRPLGYWRCVHAAPSSPFDEFTVGAIYECRTLESTSSMRIAPWEGSNWSPFWSDHDGRFCYAADKLDFEWIGKRLPAGETASTAMPDHVAARIARATLSRLAPARTRG